MVLGGEPPGRVGRRRNFSQATPPRARAPGGVAFFGFRTDSCAEMRRRPVPSWARRARVLYRRAYACGDDFETRPRDGQTSNERRWTTDGRRTTQRRNGPVPEWGRPGPWTGRSRPERWFEGRELEGWQCQGRWHQEWWPQGERYSQWWPQGRWHQEWRTQGRWHQEWWPQGRWHQEWWAQGGRYSEWWGPVRGPGRRRSPNRGAEGRWNPQRGDPEWGAEGRRYPEQRRASVEWASVEWACRRGAQ